MSALVLHDVRKTYASGHTEIVALDDANLTVAGDEIVALVGPSGSGKTTLLSIAGGLLTPTAGSVVVGGEDISEYGPRQLTAFRGTNIGFVFQSVNLVPFLNAEENLVVVADMNGQARRPARRRARQLLAELGLSERRRNLP
ncbi:MAG: ATP-binding cassette domain-containing protein, partial [Actinobacteria bacterium]|nr:ATP-binding cassette domain-containing protein [Actinomycetota bacterium]NIS36294.1 ATP-binding cassette domain-containing protein [Actinomycetota bacterium]NIT98642.1 ATP-binding cassette domain-containing protein [Actinomycetota bacterium]NIU22258.1 ATP-binding cassette domain-containing protein [Actinomycetota bacterium]NIU70840.1 ATP-binding cassette domain-containing protein [Actinomycetota bacterium]